MGVIYKTTVEEKASKKKQDTFIGITENEFKTRYNQHTSSFSLNHKQKKKTGTTLSEFIWKLKESKTECHLSLDVIERAQPYSAATNRCNLCIAEKCFILKTKLSLNKKKGNLFIVPLQKEAFAKKLSVARKRKTTVQGRNGNRTHLSHTRREGRTSENFVFCLRHQCRMKRRFQLKYKKIAKTSRMTTPKKVNIKSLLLSPCNGR